MNNFTQISTTIRDVVLDSGVFKNLTPFTQEEVSARSPNVLLIKKIVTLVKNLCKGTSMAKWTQLASALPTLRNLLDFEAETDVLIDSTLIVNSIINGNQDHLSEILNSGILPLVIRNLSSKDLRLQESSLDVILNASKGFEDELDLVVSSGALKNFDHLLRSPNEIIKKKSSSVLLELTGGNLNHVKAALAPNLITPLIQILNNRKEDEEIRNNIAHVMCRVTVYEIHVPDLIMELADKGCLPGLCDMLDSKDSELVLKILNALYKFLVVGFQNFAKEMTSKNVCAETIKVNGALDKIRKLEADSDVNISQAAKGITKYYLTEDQETPNPKDNEEVEMELDRAALDSIREFLSKDSPKFADLCADKETRKSFVALNKLPDEKRNQLFGSLISNKYDAFLSTSLREALVKYKSSSESLTSFQEVKDQSLS